MKTLNNCLLIITVFLFSCAEQSDTKVATSTTETSVQQPIDSVLPTEPEAFPEKDDKIASIRKAVQQINSQNLDVKKFGWRESSCADTGTITYYLDQGKIVKAVETGFIGDGGWTREYYYQNGKFIFSFEQNIGGPAGLPADTNELRIYVQADTLVRQIKNKTYTPDASKKITAKSREYRLLDALQTKKFGEALCI